MCPDAQRAGTRSPAPTEEGLRTDAAAPGCPTRWERHVHFFPSAAVTGSHGLVEQSSSFFSGHLSVLEVGSQKPVSLG